MATTIVHVFAIPVPPSILLLFFSIFTDFRGKILKDYPKILKIEALKLA